METQEMIQVIKEELENFKKTLPKGVTEQEIETRFNKVAEDLNKKFEGLNVQKVEELENIIKAQGLEINALKEKTQKRFKSVGEILHENKEALKNFDNSNTKLQIKVPISAVTKATVLPASFSNDSMGARLSDYGQKSFRRLKIAELFAQFPLGADNQSVIYYTDQTTATRGAAARTIGDAAAESTLSWTGYSQKLEVISDTLPVAKELFNRYSDLEAEITNFITNNLLLKEDYDLVNGNGVTPNIKGVYTYAPTFNASTYAGFKPKKAGLLDLIAVLATEIEKNTQYSVNTVIINPADALGLILEKDSNGVRINFPMLLANGEIVVRNIRVVQSAAVAANTLVIGDFTRARRYYNENILLEMGYNNSGDFAKRIVTVLGQIDELLLIRKCEEDAFLKCTDIASNIASITASEA